MANHFLIDNEAKDSEILAFVQNSLNNIEKIYYTNTTTKAYGTALELARRHTRRTKVLVLYDPQTEKLNNQQLEDPSIHSIPAGETALLCETIATSPDRIAAIVVQYKKAAPFYYKKVRELSSAEGAVMIWDELDNYYTQVDQKIVVSKSNHPDIICFKYTFAETVYCVGGRMDIMNTKLQ